MDDAHADTYSLNDLMSGCLTSVETGTLVGFPKLEFSEGANGSRYHDFEFPAGPVRVLFSEIQSYSLLMCTVFGYTDTPRKVVIRWGDVEDLADAWHSDLLATAGWEDITVGKDLGYGAMKCVQNGPSLVVTSQPVWQVFTPLAENPERTPSQNAAFQFQVRKSDGVDCDATRARTKNFRGGS